jgi:Spy/CpxP family protein refolding chaperone
MQRTKQQALMFLLGAVLVGGAVGFSADRYIGHEKFATSYGPRARFYDELGLTQQQRATLDSLAFKQDCAMRQTLAPHDSALKAIRARFQAQRDSVLTKDQQARMETRRKDILARREAEQAKEPKRTCTGN